MNGALDSRSFKLQVLDHLPIILFSVQKNGLISNLEGRGLDQLEYDAADLVGQNYFELFNDYPAADLVRRALEGETLKADVVTGNDRVYETHFFPQYGADGEVDSVLGVGLNITDRRRAEEALRKSEARGKALLAAIPDMMFEVSREGVYLDYKPAPAIASHVPPEAFLGRNIREIMPADVAERSLAAIDKVLEAGGVEHFEIELVEGGEVRYYEARMASTGPDRVLAMVNDVTERKTAERELMESERRYRRVTEQVADGVVVLRDNEVVFHNRAIEAWFGRKDGNLVLPPELTAEMDKWRRDEDELDEKKTVFEVRCEFADQDDLWFEVQGVVVPWEGRSALMATLHDITAVKTRELAIVAEVDELRQENIKLRSTMADRYRMGPIIGKTPPMRELYELIVKAAQSDANVILLGESGTGKELVAQTIFRMSGAYNQSFVPVNCGAIPETLFESEFFGHKKGAFTSAEYDKFGYIKLADQGTLFLDEVSELTTGMQVKLLRVLEDGSYTPLGTTQVERSRFRIMAAANRPLKPMVQNGEMREDFYYRINVISIHVPPLRERRPDIPLLIEHFLQNKDTNQDLSSLPADVVRSLNHHDWPGNIRELKNVLDRYLTLGELELEGGGLERTRPAESQQSPPTADSGDLNQSLAAYEKQLLLDALTRSRWRRGEAAKRLGISRRSLYRRMHNLGIE